MALRSLITLVSKCDATKLLSCDCTEEEHRSEIDRGIHHEDLPSHSIDKNRADSSDREVPEPLTAACNCKAVMSCMCREYLWRHYPWYRSEECQILATHREHQLPSILTPILSNKTLQKHKSMQPSLYSPMKDRMRPRWGDASSELLRSRRIIFRILSH